ncbi:DsbA family protein, partial [Rhizobium hidalgonense]
CALYANEAWLPDFVRFVYQANFAEDQDISSVNLISSLLAKAGQNSDEILAAANTDAAKQALKDQTQHALSINVFGAPFMMVGDEPFWGNDRLEQAIYFAANGKLPSNVTLS